MDDDNPDADPSDSDSLTLFAQQEGRKRGILTQRDRDYLMGNVDVADQEEWNLLYRLRQRVLHSPVDFRLLMSLPGEELKKIAEQVPHFDVGGRGTVPNVDGPSTLLTYLLEFAIRYAYESPHAGDPETAIADELERAFAYVLAPHFYQTEDYGHYKKPIEDVTVTIEIEEGERDVEELRNLFIHEPNALSSEEIMGFVTMADEEEISRVCEHLEEVDDEAAPQLIAYLQSASEYFGSRSGSASE